MLSIIANMLSEYQIRIILAEMRKKNQKIS